MMRSLLLTGLSALLAKSAYAFVASPPPRLVRPSHSVVSLSKDDDSDRDVASASDVMFRHFAVVCAITFSFLHPSDSFAMNENAFQSSTMTVAEVIRTMDFSLPGSYDNIVDATASGKEELTTEAVRPAASSSKKAAPKEKKVAVKKEKKEAAPKKVAMTKAEREEAAAKAKEEKAKADAERQKEIEAQIKANREAKIAARKAAEAEKEAAEAEKLQEAYKGAKIVDTGMPEY